MLTLTERHPWIALLGWFPPFYLSGIIRHWDKGWVKSQIEIFPSAEVESNFSIFWWPIRLYKEQKRKYTQNKSWQAEYKRIFRPE
jgi:hypothetical protein